MGQPGVPRPCGYVTAHKGQGTKTFVYGLILILDKSLSFSRRHGKGYFIKRSNGQIWQWDMWQPGMAIVDFTNPGAWKWFQDKLEVLLDMGVDCFKTDFGERIPPTSYTMTDLTRKRCTTTTRISITNVCTSFWSESSERTGSALCPLCHRRRPEIPCPLGGGDCWSDYESMEESLRGGLSLCMSGFWLLGA